MAGSRTSVNTRLRGLRSLGLKLLLAIMALAVVEGLSSAVLFVWGVAQTPRVGESYHTRYDPELGWVNRPSVRLPDMYGPGVSLTTNARGFRGAREIDREVTPGRIRVVCSGDSFTLGYGVGDADTWCALLEAIDPRLETVNMGQGGYGLDQAYLWFKRDARDLRHDVHLFAFVSDDFERVRDAARMGYGKPRLDVEGERLVIGNVPVPRRAWMVPWITRHLDSLRALRSFELVRRLLARSPEAASRGEGPGPARATVRRVVSKLLEDLERINRDKDSVLVLVYLPYLPEHASPSPPGWSPFIRGESERLGVVFIDVAGEFRRLPRSDAEALFIPDGPGTFPGAGGHLSVRGNRYVARAISERLSALPQLRRTGSEQRPSAKVSGNGPGGPAGRTRHSHRGAGSATARAAPSRTR